MQATVKNFRGIWDATIEISPIALLCGLNGAGKTSVARAIAAAATGKGVPFAKVTKKDAKVMLRHGTHSGSVTLTGDEGSTAIEWPSTDATSTGVPLWASDIAVGIVDFFGMKEDAALLYLIDLLKASPTFDDLKNHFSELEIDVKTAEQVWKVIEAQGWAAAHKRAVETGQQKKGAWQQITGESFGKKKITEWFPAGWEDSMADISPEALSQPIETNKKKLEEMIGKSAVSKAERDRLQSLVDSKDKLQKEAEEAKKAFEEKESAVNEVGKKLQNVPATGSDHQENCPHCEKPVNIVTTTVGKFTLRKAAPIDPTKIKEARLLHASLCGDKAKLDTELSAARHDLSRKQNAVEDAIQAKKKLANMGEEKPENLDEKVAKLREDIGALESQLKMLSQFLEAKKVAGQITVNQQIVDALDETGLRKKKLGECLDAFASSFIEPLCEDFGMPLVSIDADLNVDLGQTSYHMLSASEQFRVKTVLQLAIAQMEKSAIVIIDGADILDAKGRGKLLTTVNNIGIPAIICMTLNKQDQAPNLAQMGAGKTYWVDKGTCKQLSEERAAA